MTYGSFTSSTVSFHSGLRVHRMNYDDRLRHCSLLEGQYTRSPSDTFVPVCKAILTVEQARDMVTVHDPSAVAAGLEPYGIDGLVLGSCVGRLHARDRP